MKPGLGLMPQVARPVSCCQDFDVFMPGTRTLILIEIISAGQVILNARVGNLDAAIDERQIELFCNLFFYVLDIAFRVGLAFGVDGFLNLRLQFKVELYAQVCAALLLDALGFFAEGAINLASCSTSRGLTMPA